MAAPSKRERAFLQAAYDGDLKLVKRLASELGDGEGLSKGYETVTDEKGVNALHRAAVAGRTQICKFLVEKLKFNVESTDIKGNTPLLMAIENNHHPTAVYLIENGAAAIDCINIWGETALHLAVYLGHKEIMRLLLSKGAKVDHDRRITPNSPLELACHHGTLESVKLLLDNDADARLNDREDSELVSMRSLCWKELNQPKHALDHAKICVEMKPDWAEAHYRLGAAWMVLKGLGDSADVLFGREGV